MSSFLRIPLCYAIISTFFLVGCQSKKTETAKFRQQGPVLAEGFLVTPQQVSEHIEVPGTVLPQEQTQIKSEVSGRIVKLNIQEGALVKRGTLLLKLFDGDLQAQLQKLKVQLQIAQKSEERQGELLKISGISQQDYDLIALNVDNLEADIEALEIAISKTEIRAPYDGKLGLRNVSLGAYISPAEVVTSIRQVHQLKLEFAVPEKYAGNITKGYPVTFTTDAGPQFYKASVIASENSVDETTRTLRVRAVIDQRQGALVPGVFAKVSLQLGNNSNALLVPTQAVIPQARSKQVLIYKKDSIVFQPVETGIRDSAYIQITKGVTNGDTIIITGLMAIRPNSKVKLAKVSKYKEK